MGQWMSPVRRISCKEDEKRRRRGPGGRAAAHRDRPPQPCGRLVQRPGDRVPPGDERQRPRLRLHGVRQGLPHLRAEAHPDQAIHPQDQRQSGAIHPDALPGVGLRHGFQELGGAEPVAASVPVDLQPSQEALSPGLALTSAAAQRAALLTNVVRHNT